MSDSEFSSYGDSVDAEINIISRELGSLANRYNMESMSEIIKRGFHIHDVLKCELFVVGSNLGYIPMPEFTVFDGEIKKRFDMAWIRNNKIVYIFELQNVTNVTFIDRILKSIGRPIFLNVRVDKTFILTIDDLLGFGWIRELLGRGRLIKLPFKWDFHVGDIFKVSLDNGELVFHRVDNDVNGRGCFVSAVGQSFKPMIQVPTMFNIKRGDIIEMRKTDNNVFIARLGFTPGNDRNEISLLDENEDITPNDNSLGGWSGSAIVELNMCNIRFEEAF